MRSAARCLALLPLLLLALARPAHADTMDVFSITTTGVAIDFSLPASTTQPCCSFTGQFNFGSVDGTVNGVSEPVTVSFITGSGCAVCGTILLGYPSTNWTINLPPLYDITFSGTFPNQDETLTFIPGDYMIETFGTLPPFASFDIKVASETAPTPEPPTLFLSAFAAVSLCGLLLMKRRVLR